MTDTTRPTSAHVLQRAAELCLEKRSDDIVALDVRSLVDYMDYLLIVTGRSGRQNRAIADNVIRALKKEDSPPLSRSGVEVGSWICLDFVDVVVHIFDPETRAHYDLELLWADATPVELDLDAVAVAVEEDDDPLDEGVIEP